MSELPRRIVSSLRRFIGNRRRCKRVRARLTFTLSLSDPRLNSNGARRLPSLDGHTLDIQPWVGADFLVQGIAFEHFAAVSFDGRDYGILRCHGITRPELEFAQQTNVGQLLQRRRVEGVYPRTHVQR
jgi:hypothetical protein